MATLRAFTPGIICATLLLMRNFIFCLACLLPALVHAQPLPDSLEVREAFMAPAKARNTVVPHLRLANPGPQNVVITRALSPMSGLVVLRAHSKKNGQTVIESGGRITIPPKSVVRLLPGATEIALLNLVQPLRAGAEFPLTLVFESGAQQTLRVKVTE